MTMSNGSRLGTVDVESSRKEMLSYSSFKEQKSSYHGDKVSLLQRGIIRVRWGILLLPRCDLLIGVHFNLKSIGEVGIISNDNGQ